MDSKRYKRKLIFELGTGCESHGDIPKEYSNSKLKWQCDVIVEGCDDLINEYSIAPDKKIFLNDFLDIIKDEIVKITDDKAVSWGIKLYRVVKKNR
jgi:uncharacterized FlgJ-related protein